MELDLAFLEKVKKIAIIAMVSDDYLMDTLVLKGGTAIDLIYDISDRASIDIDFSIVSEFEKTEIKAIESKIKKVLSETFNRENLVAFDIKFIERPQKKQKDIEKFWGGYCVEFKVIPKDLYEKNRKDISLLRKTASIVGPDNKRTFVIDISKFEYCRGRKKEDLSGYTVYVYTPEMIVFEKIRAICQQLPEYKKIIKTQTPNPRAKDFFDIYIVMKNFSIDLYSDVSKEILKKIFKAKKVPFVYLQKIREHKEFHRGGYPSLQDTVRKAAKLKEFDFYFDYVVERIEKILS